MLFADIGGYSMHYRLDVFTDPWTEPERCPEAVLRFIDRLAR